MKWRIGFPEIEHPFLRGQRVLVLKYSPDPEAPGRAIAECFGRQGRPVRLGFTIAELLAAPVVNLVETDDLRAPPGTILDRHGHAARG